MSTETAVADAYSLLRHQLPPSCALTGGGARGGWLYISQTRFVLKKALALGKKVVLVINKIDRYVIPTSSHVRASRRERTQRSVKRLSAASLSPAVSDRVGYGSLAVTARAPTTCWTRRSISSSLRGKELHSGPLCVT